MDRPEIYYFLRSHRYGVLSGVSADGLPQSALVGIAIITMLDIVFDTLKSSRKYPNLLREPRCSFVIGWTGEQTLQLEGVAEEPSGDELARLQAAVQRKTTIKHSARLNQLAMAQSKFRRSLLHFQ